MTSSLVYAAVAALLPLAFFFFQFLSTARTIPGPLTARFTGAWYIYALLRGDFEKINLDLHRKHGPVVRLSPKYYSVSDPDTIRKIYHGSPNDPNANFDKSPWYEPWFLPGSRILFNEPSASVHAHMRKKYSEPFSMSFMVTLEHHVDECIRVFGSRLQEFCEAGASVDLVQWFKCYAADAVGMLTYGQRFGYLDHGNDIEGMFETVQANITYGTITGTYHWLHPIVFAVMELGSKLGIMDGNARASVGRYAMSRLMERKQARYKEKSPRINDQLDKFLAYQEEHPDTLTDFHILDALSGNLVAGSDTTAITLCAIFCHVHKQPHILAKLRQELDQTSTRITYKETLALPYLQAIISETLRFHPAVGLPLWRTVPSSGLEVDGKYIPPGANVGANAWVLHRDTSIFGPDADIFRPERWIEASKEELAVMNRHDLAFGAGSRTCLGKNVSLIEMAKVVVELLRKFEFEFENKEGESEWETKNLWFVQPKELRMKMSEIRR